MSESSCYGLQQRSEQCRDSGGVPRGESGLAHHTWPSGKVGAPAVPVSSLHASRFRRSTLVVHRSSGIKMFLFLEICAASKSSLVHDLKKTKKNNPSLSRIFFVSCVEKFIVCLCVKMKYHKLTVLEFVSPWLLVFALQNQSDQRPAIRHTTPPTSLYRTHSLGAPPPGLPTSLRADQLPTQPVYSAPRHSHNGR